MVPFSSKTQNQRIYGTMEIKFHNDKRSKILLFENKQRKKFKQYWKNRPKRRNRREPGNTLLFNIDKETSDNDKKMSKLRIKAQDELKKYAAN